MAVTTETRDAYIKGYSVGSRHMDSIKEMRARLTASELRLARVERALNQLVPAGDDGEPAGISE